MTSGNGQAPSKRAFCGLALAASVLLVSGCATPPFAQRSPTSDPRAGPWSGRLALRIDANPPQSLAAGFELKGQPDAGELVLSTPIGSTLAALVWAPGSASLRSGGQVQAFESLDALMTHATGAAIPVRALFDWLDGTATTVPGWEADLSRLGDGRLLARRAAPAPPVELRLILDR